MNSRRVNIYFYNLTFIILHHKVSVNAKFMSLLLEMNSRFCIDIRNQEACIKEFMDKAKSNIEMSEVTPKLLNLFGAHIKFSERKSRNSGYPKRG